MTVDPIVIASAARTPRGGFQSALKTLVAPELGDDTYDPGRLMGTYAEEVARQYGYSREAQDRNAIASLTPAQDAIRSRRFKGEIVPVAVGSASVEDDEQPLKANVDRIPQLRPAAFTTAPIGAIQKLFDKTGWNTRLTDLFEINEAFAVVAMAAIDDLKLDSERVDVNGGACALGHPLGASGARIMVALLHALEQRELGRGIAALCIGGGEATAIALERMR